jgi:hypothetical protein
MVLDPMQRRVRENQIKVFCLGKLLEFTQSPFDSRVVNPRFSEHFSRGIKPYYSSSRPTLFQDSGTIARATAKIDDCRRPEQWNAVGQVPCGLGPLFLVPQVELWIPSAHHGKGKPQNSQISQIKRRLESEPGAPGEGAGPAADSAKRRKQRLRRFRILSVRSLLVNFGVETASLRLLREEDRRTGNYETKVEAGKHVASGGRFQTGYRSQDPKLNLYY